MNLNRSAPSGKLTTAFFLQTRNTFCKRIESKAAAIFTSNDIMPRNGDQFFNYRQNSDLFYFTGIEQEDTFLFVYPDAGREENKEILFIRKTDDKMIQWEGPKLDKELAAEISGIKNIQFSPDFFKVIKEVLNEVNILYLNKNEYPTFRSELKTLDLRLISRVQNDFPFLQLKAASPILAELRMIKSKEEVAIIKEACRITGDCFLKILNELKPGMKEYQVQAIMDHHFKYSGTNGHAYHPIVASGKNACYLHYNSNNKLCNAGDLLLMDFGCEYHNYASDLSRTIPVSGRFSGRQKELYQAVLNVFYSIRKEYKVGQTIEGINKLAGMYLEEELLKLGILDLKEVKNQPKANPLYKKYLPHGIIHHIGLDVHDVFEKDKPFERGMVFSCEPAIYITNEEIGIRLENDIHITENSPEDLMKDIPLETEDIEEIMQAAG